MAEQPHSWRRALALAAATYGAWLVTLALGGASVYYWLGVARELYIRLRLNPYGFAAWQNGAAILLIVAWIVLAVGSEGWYRTGATRGRLAGRVARLVTIEVVSLLLGIVVLRLV